MKDRDKTKEQLMSELEEMRQRIAELENAEGERKRAEEALRECYGRLHHFIESATDSFTIWDSELNLVDMNEATLRYHPAGTKKEDVIGKNILDISPGLKETGRYDQYLKAVKTGETFLVDDLVPHPQFGDRHLAVRAFKIDDGLGVIVTDITKLKLAEALRESEECYRSVVELCPDTIAIHSEGKIVFINTTGARLLGAASPEQLIGKSIMDLLHPDYRKIVEERLRKAREEGREVSLIEEKFIRFDGTDVDVEVAATPITYQGKPAIQAIARDITDRKRAEEALRESQAELSTIWDNTPIVMILVDQERRARKVNLTAVKFAKRAVEEMIGLRGGEALRCIHSVDDPRGCGFGDYCEGCTVRELVLDTFETGNNHYQVEAKLQFASQEEDLSFLISTTLLNLVEGQRVLVCIEDITERKRVEEEIERHCRRVEALYAIAHVVSRTDDLDELLNEALASVLEVMDTDVGGIYLLNLQAGVFTLWSQIGMSEETIASIGSIKLEEEEIKRGLEWQEPVFEPEGVFNEANVARIAAAIENEGVRAHIIVPFWSKGVPLGALVIGDRRERQFSAEEIDLLRAIGNEIAVGIENAELLERTRELSVTDELTGLYNRRYFYKMIDTEIHRTKRYGRSFSLVMLDVDGFKEYNDRFGHTNGDAVLQSLAQTLKSTLRKSDTAFRYGGDEFTIILPATDTNRAKGIIDRIRSKWLQMPKVQYPILESPLGFSAGIAQFPENAETADGLVFLADTALYHAKKEGGYRATLVSDLETLPLDIMSMATLDQVYALAATVDAKDPYTYGHSTRVANIAETIGKAIGLSGNELSDLYAASMLHDIGKVGVPDLILTKPGALIKGEWGIVKKHSAEGAKVIGYVKELRVSVPMILHHHEWYDGSGYPDGLKGEEISLGARIISVADAYDTMTTPRLYRDVISHEEACEELRRYSGTQFDSELVEAFCRATSEANWQN